MLKVVFGDKSEQMEAFAEWSDEFIIRLEKLDEDHEKLFLLVNELHAAVKDMATQQVLGHILDELLHYLQYHFAHEEKLFALAKYPGEKRHCHQHQVLTGAIKEIRADFHDRGHDSLSPQVLEFMRYWLYEHVARADRAFADYFNENGIPHSEC